MTGHVIAPYTLNPYIFNCALDMKQRFVDFVKRVWGNRIFLILLIFNIISNGTAVVSYPDAVSILYILGISALSATVESFICHLFSGRLLRRCVLYLFLALHLFMIIIDFFLIANFKMIFTADSIGIISETTAEESQAFLSTYLGFGNVLLIVAAVCIGVWAVMWLARKLAKKLPVALASLLLTLVGVFAYAQMAYNHATAGEGGNSLSQLHSFTRLGYSFLSFRGTYANIQVLRDVNRQVEASQSLEEPPTVVFVIGESFSLYHSSLYGYSKPTNPRLAQRVADGSLILFDNAVSSSDHTGNVMKSVLSVAGSDEPHSSQVQFPTCFRKAGYKTALVDNQYFVRDGFSWLTDGTLSGIMFDYRNKKKAGLDMTLLDSIPAFPDPQLIMIHLFGQHFTYSDRYTPEFKHFTEADYSNNLSQSEREVVAHYDNATLYNDYVVDSIISKFKDKNCIIVYMSDHGEEIYEIDDFMGHGNAKKRPTIQYQLRVPFMIWTSEKFREQYPDVTRRIADSSHKPIITDDLPHFLFEVAGIDTKYYCPELSFINDQYQPSKPRIVLGNTDYDKYKPDPSFKPRY